METIGQPLIRRRDGPVTTGRGRCRGRCALGGASLVAALALALAPAASAQAVKGRIVKSGWRPGALALYEKGNRLFVHDRASRAVFYFDATTLAEGGSLPLGIDEVWSMVVDEQYGKLYVGAAIPGSGDRKFVTVIDAASPSVLKTLTTSGFTQLVKDEGRHRVYASYNGGVSAIDVASDTVTPIAGITGGNLYTSMSVNPVTHELFVANWSQNGGVLYVVAPDTLVVTRVPGLGGFGVTVDWKENKAYVAYCGTEGFCVYDRASGAVTSFYAHNDSTAVVYNPLTGRVHSTVEVNRVSTIIDGRDGSWINVGFPDGGNVALGVNEATGHVFYVMPGETHVMDGWTGALLARIPVSGTITSGFISGAVVVDSGKGRVFLLNDDELGTVTLVDDLASCNPCNPVCTLALRASVPATGIAGVPVPFDATVVPASCPAAPKVSWSFGDNATSFQEDPQHTYATAGRYGWDLTASFPGGVGLPLVLRSGSISVACAGGQAAPDAEIAIAGSQRICGSQTVNLTVTLTAGTPPFSVTISGKPYGPFAASPATIPVTPTSTTTYNLTSVTAAGCMAALSRTVQVVVAAAPAVTLSGPSWAITAGQTANLTVSLTAGMPPFSFVLNGATYGPFAAGTATIPVTPTTSTLYTVASATAGGCTQPQTASAVVSVAEEATVIPIVLSSSGLNGSFFTSELTMTNPGTTAALLQLSYIPAFGGSPGSAPFTIAPGVQEIVPDAVEFLRSLGIPVGSSGNRGGTLRIGSAGSTSGAATVRTTTTVPGGRAGLAYSGLGGTQLLSAPAYVCGLRQNGSDRSNVAVLHAGSGSDAPITLRLTVISGDPGRRVSHALPDIVLSPGEFRQLSGVLTADGLSLSNGYVLVERVSGVAPFTAYGVINDQANSDGSFVEPVPANVPAAVLGLTLPVLVESPAFSSELVLTNVTSIFRNLRFRYEAAALSGGHVDFDVALRPYEQQILPDIVNVLRGRRIVRDPVGATFAGALFVSESTGDLRGISVAARTSAPGGGGRYGLFYGSVPAGSEATTEAWLFGLQQTAETRTNVALVNAGSIGTNTFRIQLFDGDTGQAAGTVEGLTVPARGFLQLNAILAAQTAKVTNGYARVTRTSGSSPFLAYAVLNDGARPDDRSGDGAYLPGTVPAP